MPDSLGWSSQLTMSLPYMNLWIKQEGNPSLEETHISFAFFAVSDPAQLLEYVASIIGERVNMPKHICSYLPNVELCDLKYFATLI